jgi:glutathione S-transferase
MKLFGHPDSGHSLKVKFFLNWLEVEHEYEFVDIFAERTTRSSEFLKASKFSEVPTLIDNGQCHIQSNAILVYLSEKFAKFKNSNEKQRCLEWLVWEANKIGMCLPQLRANEKLSKTYPEFKLSQGAYDWLIARYKNDVGVLNEELADKQFILGNVISPADFSLSAYLLYADEANVETPKNVERWLDRMREQKGWQGPHEMLKG